MPSPILKTQRLLLRNWKDTDLPHFAKINQNNMVMEHFPSILSREQSDALAQKIRLELKEKNYGLWAVEVIDKEPFIGFVGLHAPDFKAHFTPCVEIGWRLGHEFWRKGYAFEAATKVIEYAFNTLKLNEIVSFTTPGNIRSWSLMEKLGMTHDPKDDFHHPKLPIEHPLSLHVLYRLKNLSY